MTALNCILSYAVSVDTWRPVSFRVQTVVRRHPPDLFFAFFSCLAVCLLPDCSSDELPETRPVRVWGGAGGWRPNVRTREPWCRATCALWQWGFGKSSYAWLNCDGEIWTVVSYQFRDNYGSCPPPPFFLLTLNPAFVVMLLFSIDPNLGAQAKSNKENECVHACVSLCIFSFCAWIENIEFMKRWTERASCDNKG